MATLTANYQYLSRSSVMSSLDSSLSYYILLYAKTSANVATGVHTVTLKEVLASTNNNATFYLYKTTYSGTVDGKTAFSGKNEPSDAWEMSSFTEGGVTYKTGTVIAEKSVSVDASSGVAKNISLSCFWSFDDTNEAWYAPPYLTQRTVTTTVTLPAIPRATTPTLSATPYTMGTPLTITLTPGNKTFKHKILYDFGNLSSQTAGISSGSNFTPQGDTTVTFTPPVTLAEQIINANNGKCMIYCYTYTSDGTSIGTKSIEITLNVPAYTPNISNVTLTGNNLLSGIYVQTKSTITANASLNTYYGAGIKSIVAEIDGKTYTKLPFTSSVLSNGDKTVKITFTDTRGKSATYTSSVITVYPYSSPSITTFTLERQSDGTTVIATVKGSVSAVNDKNIQTITVKLNGVTNTLTSALYSISATTTFKNVPTDYTLTGTATIKDYYNQPATKDSILPTVEVTMDFYRDGKGVAFGKVAETTDLLEVAWNGKFKKNLEIEGTLTVGGKMLEQIKPEFASTIEECTDTTKLYVLPDGYIYAYLVTYGGKYKNYADPTSSDWLTNYRLSTSSTSALSGCYVTNYIPCKVGDTIRVKGLDVLSKTSSSGRQHLVDASKTMVTADCGYVYDLQTMGLASQNGDTITITAGYTVASGKSYSRETTAYIRLCGFLLTGYTLDDVVITVNEEIVDVTASYQWNNTGHAFVPVDYEDRIIAVENGVASCSSKLSTLEVSLATTEEDSSIPEYWLEELRTKANLIQKAVETAGKNKSAFLWYTDAHWPDNSKMSPLLLKYLVDNTPINKVNFGGDIVGDPSSYTHDNIKYAYEWKKMIAGIPNHHSVFGNHDLQHWTVDVRNIAYSVLLSSEENSNMVVGGNSYYYIDNPSEKTRYLYLGYMLHYNLGNDLDTVINSEKKEQANFIINALNSVENGWHIVVIAHRWYQYSRNANNEIVTEGGSVPVYEAEILNLFDKYNARTTYVASTYFAAQDFKNAKGKVEFCIGGHIHLDYDFTSNGGIPVIITAADTNQERNSSKQEDYGALKTTAESAVFGVIADYNTNKITVVGVGRGTSRVINKSSA